MHRLTLIEHDHDHVLSKLIYAHETLHSRNYYFYLSVNNVQISLFQGIHLVIKITRQIVIEFSYLNIAYNV